MKKNIVVYDGTLVSDASGLHESAHSVNLGDSADWSALLDIIQEYKILGATIRITPLVDPAPGAYALHAEWDEDTSPTAFSALSAMLEDRPELTSQVKSCKSPVTLKIKNPKPEWLPVRQTIQDEIYHLAWYVCSIYNDVSTIFAMATITFHLDIRT